VEGCDVKSLELSEVNTKGRGEGVTGRSEVLVDRGGSKFFTRPEDLLRDFMIVPLSSPNGKWVKAF